MFSIFRNLPDPLGSETNNYAANGYAAAGFVMLGLAEYAADGVSATTVLATLATLGFAFAAFNQYYSKNYSDEDEPRQFVAAQATTFFRKANQAVNQAIEHFSDSKENKGARQKFN